MKKSTDYIQQPIVTGFLIVFAIIGTFALMVAASNLGIESPQNAKVIREATAECEGRGGKFIANPHGFFAFLGKANGQGCSKDYERWEEYKAERRAENARLKLESK
jgi:hypothetical protein